MTNKPSSSLETSTLSTGVDAQQLIKNYFSGGGAQRDDIGLGSESLSQTIGRLWQTTKDNRWIIMMLVILGCLFGTLRAISETPVYQARLTMAVEPGGVQRGNQSIFDPFAFRFYETQYELLKSRSVAERVVDELNLVGRESATRLLVPISTTQAILRELSKITGIGLYERSRGESDLSIDTMSEQQLQQRRSRLTHVIQSGVSVAGGEKTNLVTVTFRSIDAELAAEVANSLVDAYIEQGLDSQLNRTQQTTQWLSQRIDDLRTSLDTSQAELQAFLVAENLLESSRSNQIADSDLQALNAVYLNARAELAELEKRYGSKHPKITEARNEMLTAKRRLDQKSRSISASRVKQIELDRLEREVKRNQDLYDAFLSKFKEADLSSSGDQVASARIVDPALVPGAPIFPVKQTIILTWTFGGLLLGLFVAFLREQLDSTFKHGRVVEEKLGIPLLGVIQALSDDTQNIERHYLHNKRSVFAESINHIRTGIIYSNVDNPPQVVVVTSSVQSEGKTTLASNLALAYSQLGKTLLIDADLRRPRIKYLVEGQNSSGLVDYVAGAVNISECLYQDKEEENLYILNSGTTPPNPLELLSSDRLKSILTGLRTKFEYIVIDTAPVLPASDAVVLGTLCDALLMVIQSDRTTHHMARDAIKRLQSSKVSIEGLILTQANIKKGNPYQYGGYYGYGAYAYVENETHELSDKSP